MLRRKLVEMRTRVRLLLERRQARRLDANFIGFDKYRRSGAYHWRELETNPEYRAKIDLIAGHLTSASRVLDLGCGDGAYVGALAPLSKDIVGIDADEHAIAAASGMLEAAGVENARCLRTPLGSVTEQRLGSFDVVYSMDVIEHLPDPKQLVSVARSMLDVGGTFIVGTPLFLGKALQSPYHVKEFVADEVRRLLVDHFEIDEERLLPETRLDGERHDESFFVAICRSRP